ncbi:ATP-binding protein [Pendulispora rubella]|uniref:ATP-binding protein n=1 Tax=Pendulispora rubella TaxID=2741070 RepID=A0ABZ2LHK5_9BACT
MEWVRLRLERAVSGATEESEQALADAEAAMIASAWGSPSRLEVLIERFALSKFEYEVLLLCLAMEIDTSVAPLCARAQQDPRKAYPTFALAMSLFDEPTWDALSPERPLRLWHLIELDAIDTLSLTARALRIDERVLSFVKGVHHVDARWMPLLEPLEGARDLALPPSHRAIADAVVRRIGAGSRETGFPAVQLVGRDAQSVQLIAAHVEDALGFRPYRLHADLLPSGTNELDLLVRLWRREAMLGPVALYVDAHNVGESSASTLERFIARVPGVVLVGTREPRATGDRSSAIFEVSKPTAAERSAIWLEHLGPEAEDLAGRLSGQFELDTVAIQGLAATVSRDPDGALDGAGLWHACVDATAPRVEGLARRITPHAQWDDLVLPEKELSQLREMAAQVEHRTTVYDTWGFGARSQRGLALTALFSGESGTGKTFAAEVLASELKLQLLFIDLSAVVSKYIGETEKNLRRVFDGAEDSGAILFFDEADACFGKRSDVKDSHDRYANLEVSYLLQRMEAYRGLAILATNMKSALDPAFMRRLRFSVRFAFPGERERRAIWRRAFPAEAPLGRLDYERLAKFALTGGSIRNVSMNAAFAAAQARTVITMPAVLGAIRSELQKLERRSNESEFRWQESELDDESDRITEDAVAQ